jgi:hypothetical protein
MVDDVGERHLFDLADGLVQPIREAEHRHPLGIGSQFFAASWMVGTAIMARAMRVTTTASALT